MGVRTGYDLILVEDSENLKYVKTSDEYEITNCDPELRSNIINALSAKERKELYANSKKSILKQAAQEKNYCFDKEDKITEHILASFIAMLLTMHEHNFLISKETRDKLIPYIVENNIFSHIQVADSHTLFDNLHSYEDFEQYFIYYTMLIEHQADEILKELYTKILQPQEVFFKTNSVEENFCVHYAHTFKFLDNNLHLINQDDFIIFYLLCPETLKMSELISVERALIIYLEKIGYIEIPQIVRGSIYKNMYQDFVDFELIFTEKDKKDCEAFVNALLEAQDGENPPISKEFFSWNWSRSANIDYYNTPISRLESMLDTCEPYLVLRCYKISSNLYKTAKRQYECFFSHLEILSELSHMRTFYVEDIHTRIIQEADMIRKNQELKEKNAQLQQEHASITQLRNESKEKISQFENMKKRIAELEKENKELRHQTIQNNKKKISSSKNQVSEKITETTEENINEEATEKIDISILKDLNILVIGGHYTNVRKMQEKYPNFKFMTEIIDTSNVAKKDAVVILSKFVSHAKAEKAQTAAREHNVPLILCDKNNIQLVEEHIAKQWLAMAKE